MEPATAVVWELQEPSQIIRSNLKNTQVIFFGSFGVAAPSLGLVALKHPTSVWKSKRESSHDRRIN